MLVEVLTSVFNIQIFLFIILGVFTGICIGALPGLTATMGVALVLPLTFGLEAVPGILLLIGVYVGAIYGGSISGILLRTPGTPAAAATAIDGFEFSKRGESGRAMGISTISSFIGGVVSVLALWLISPQLAKLALRFSAPEFFLLAVFGLSIIASISGNSLAKGVLCGALGVSLSFIGIDGITGFPRFTFNNINLLSGMSFIPVMIGLFAMSQAFNTVEGIFTPDQVTQKISHVWPSKSDWKIILKYAPISGLIGTFIGIVPGAGAEIGAFVSYSQAKRMSNRPELFGTGIPEAIAAPEGGNNGVTGGALIPMLTMGVPGDAVAAIMIGALTVQGLQPGPLLFTEHTTLVYSIFLGMFIANVAMVVLGLSSLKLFVKVLSIPKSILTPMIFILCVVGSYAINTNFFDVGVMLFFGILGYFMQKADISVSPAVLGLILGPMAESNFRRALLMSEGTYGIFFTSPIAWVFVILTLFTLLGPKIGEILKKKNQIA
ncbi:tripartite tricarboxylate transporter permease [Sphaerochaeta sp. S2]|uniref:tripartite tricarboxylate transporter permease n=1 Tax=Sphaerochaeta sp. S2 TaxID=2798868 RepID=UPI0018E91A38|nr:tripartite tricarboxylate transporter permease [Sphaerochaeta sp. S2]MBJ2356508.1 tripartite tricarboxylate transporter permease [Sphaerochaeta sp. S2]MCK9347611.1 tripartite tricarboxylate transporter permease [Sphaerochaeta sp.]